MKINFASVLFVFGFVVHKVIAVDVSGIAKSNFLRNSCNHKLVYSSSNYSYQY